MRDGKSALDGLPFLGPANKQLVAFALGIEDTEKAHTWMQQCAKARNAKSVEDMVDYLVDEFGVSRVEVDSTSVAVLPMGQADTKGVRRHKHSVAVVMRRSTETGAVVERLKKFGKTRGDSDWRVLVAGAPSAMPPGQPAD